jgi:transposase
VLSNGWQIGVLRADGSGRPVWMGHRPQPHRPQPLEFNDYVRAVADSGMSGAKWIVAVGDDWRPRLFAGDKEALEEWKKLNEYVRYFDGSDERWKDFQVWPSVVVVHDPSDQSSFDSFDVLNMLAVRQVPHRVVLRPDFKAHAVGTQTRVLAFDYAPPDDSERQTLQSFTQGGGTLVTGPRWYNAQSEAGSQFPRVVAGAGSIRGFPTAQAVDSDRFSRAIRDMVDQKHGAPKLYNVGSIISLYSVNPETGQALLQMTEYGDYPTENVTVRLPNKIRQARLYVIGAEPRDLKIYDGEDGGSEIDVPQVPTYCALLME